MFRAYVIGPMKYHKNFLLFNLRQDNFMVIAYRDSDIICSLAAINRFSKQLVSNSLIKIAWNFISADHRM